MKTESFARVFLTCCFMGYFTILLLGRCAVGQLTITPSNNATNLANIFVGGNVPISGVQLVSATNQSGEFYGGTSGNVGLGFDSGIVLTTGDVRDAPFASNGYASTELGLPGDSDLHSQSRDAAKLEFDFTLAQPTRLVFEFVFASEEYPDYVGWPYNDKFALFIDGTNVAMVPGTTTPISINTVNSGSAHAQYFVDNVGTVPPFNIEYNGFTTAIKADSGVLAAGTHHMKVTIADVADERLDSAVFLRANSFRPEVSVVNCAGDHDNSQGGDALDTPYQRPLFKQALAWEHNNHHLHDGVGLQFDESEENHTFGHTFDGIPVNTIDLTQPVFFTIKSDQWGGNDAIKFQLRDADVPSVPPGDYFSPPMSWSMNMDDFMTTYGVGSTATVDLRSLFATHGSLAGDSIAKTIKDLGHLDVFIQDDTNVDYMCLSYETMAQCGDFETEQVICKIVDEYWTSDHIVTGWLSSLNRPLNKVTLSPTAANNSSISVSFGNGSQVYHPPGSNDPTTYLGNTTDSEILIKNAYPGQTVCLEFNVGEGAETCTFQKCVTIPGCYCAQVDQRSVEITNEHQLELPSGGYLMSFNLTFEMIYTFNGPLQFVDVVLPGSATPTPNRLDITGWNFLEERTFTIGVFGASPGSVIPVQFNLDYGGGGEVCDYSFEITTPLTGDDITVVGDPNGDGVANLLDVQPFIDIVTGGQYDHAADVNFDGEVNLLDVGGFVDLLSGQ